VRAIGPSLAAAGIPDPLQDPTIGIYDQNGSVLATNDNWQDDLNATDLELNHLSPAGAAESGTILHLPPGAYTAVMAGADAGTGVGLVEVYNLE
jgi:hypothetical protein